MFSFKIVEYGDLGALFDVTTTPAQERFVAPNAVSIAQAAYDPSSTAYGIWDDKTAVGFLSLVDMSHPDAVLDEGDNPDGVYVWRLLVSKDRQGQGIGRAALEFAERCARELGRAHIALSAVEAEGGPIGFYEKLGFTRSGRIVDGEVEFLKVLSKA